ncbi:hypothetical protein HK097_007848 [Rhizophlyctis rosea]|uniref:Uncharacterized protein n=1 Tax=Rhizophlyctis rosea TaxID=64517 RepID=A0AAD5X4B4_9FUNG|nr:hypothetical protein HK097_007848 [Rhizophlyctis rosea]
MAADTKTSFQNERDVKDYLIQNPDPDFPTLIADGWDFVEGYPQHGVGDLVFANEAKDKHLVVEVKLIQEWLPQDLQQCKRDCLEKQVKTYTRLWSAKDPTIEVYGRANINAKWQELIGPIPPTWNHSQTPLQTEDKIEDTNIEDTKVEDTKVEDTKVEDTHIEDKLGGSVRISHIRLGGSIGLCAVAPIIVVACVPSVLAIAGFTAGGVAAGSVAAGAQAVIGNVVAGSAFAVLQSAGAGGAGLATVNVVAGTGATIVAGISTTWAHYCSKR